MIPADSSPDADLLAACRAGDAAAFGALVRRHRGQVERIVIRMLGPGDDAEDAAQETFIRFHAALEGFREEAAVSTYLSRIAINLALNVLRRRKWQRLRFVRQPELGEGAMVETGAQPDEDLVAAERRKALQAALAGLSDDHRAVVVLRMLEEYPTRTVAAMLKIPEGTVMSRLTRALQKLQQELRAQGMEGP